MIKLILLFTALYLSYKYTKEHKKLSSEKLSSNDFERHSFYYEKFRSLEMKQVCSYVSSFFLALICLSATNSTKEIPVGYISEKAFATAYVSTSTGNFYSSTKPYDLLVWSANKHRGFEIIKYNVFGFERGREFKAVYDVANLK